MQRSIDHAISTPSLPPAQGRKFLSSLFNLQPQLVRELTAIVRNQVPGGRATVLDAYGEVLFRAWRDAAGPCLLEVENDCIQVGGRDQGRKLHQDTGILTFIGAVVDV